MMAKPKAGSRHQRGNEFIHKNSDFPKFGIGYCTYSLTNLSGRRESLVGGHQGRGKVGQLAVPTLWLSNEVGRWYPNNQHQEVTGTVLYTQPEKGNWNGRGLPQDLETRNDPGQAVPATASSERASPMLLHRDDGTRQRAKCVPLFLLCSPQKRASKKSFKCLNCPK